MYVGDSPLDLPPLTAADVGIVVGANPLLRAVAAAAGLQFQPLVAGECTSNFQSQEILILGVVAAAVLQQRPLVAGETQSISDYCQP